MTTPAENTATSKLRSASDTISGAVKKVPQQGSQCRKALAAKTKKKRLQPVEPLPVKTHIIDLLVNSVTVWDEPDGYRITSAYNLTSAPTKTFKVDGAFPIGMVLEIELEPIYM